MRWPRSVVRAVLERAPLSSDADSSDDTVDCAEFDVGPAALAVRSARLWERTVELERFSRSPIALRPTLN
ncbi:MAG TPA: hypothetical protein VHO95_00760 [Candidatus Dormibacteraeota bacterium]|nr:hypothetical protein [Candidatus Dormibacteraeota bacterium]